MARRIVRVGTRPTAPMVRCIGKAGILRTVLTGPPIGKVAIPPTAPMAPPIAVQETPFTAPMVRRAGHMGTPRPVINTPIVSIYGVLQDSNDHVMRAGNRRGGALGAFLVAAMLSVISFAPRMVSAGITISGREADNASACSSDLPRFELGARAFLDLAKASSDPRAYGRCMINIRFTGEINRESMTLLRDVLNISFQQVKALGVGLSLDSPGGDVAEALETANFIRHKQYTRVIATVPKNADCFSSCVFLLAGSYKRLVLGRVGIHRPYFTAQRARELGYSDTKKAYDDIGGKLTMFVRAANLSDKLVLDMWQTPSHRVKILTDTELQEYGLLDDDAVLVELENAKIREACGNDAPAYREDFEQNVFSPCIENNRVDASCMQERVRVHPYCSCWTKLNPKMALVCQ